MANTVQAKKRARQAEKHRQHNSSFRSMFLTAIKSVVAAIETGDKDQAQAAYTAAVPVIDRMADKGIIQKVPSPVRLTVKSQITVDEAAYYYDGGAEESLRSRQGDKVTG